MGGSAPGGGPLRSACAALLALVLAALVAPADAHGPRAGGLRAASPFSSGPIGPRHPGEAMRRLTERRSFEAGVRLREISRDAARRAEETRLRRTGTPRQVRSYRRRVRVQEDLDDLSIRAEADRLDRAWLARQGPVTRRVLAESGIRLQRARRRAEQERRLDALERDVERRQPSPGLGD